MKASLLALCFVLTSTGSASAQGTKAAQRASVGVRYEWHEGDTRREAWLDESQVAEWGTNGAAQDSALARHAQLAHKKNHLKIWRLPQRSARTHMGQLRAQGHENLAAVFRAGPDESFAPQVLTGHLLIFFPADWSLKTITDWASRHQLRYVEALSVGKNGHRLKAPSAGPELLDLLRELARSAEVGPVLPEWWQDRRAR